MCSSWFYLDFLPSILSISSCPPCIITHTGVGTAAKQNCASAQKSDSQTSTPSQGWLGKGLSFYSFINQSFRRSKLPMVLTSWSKFDPKHSFCPSFDPRLTVYYSSKVISYSRFTGTNIWCIRGTPELSCPWYLRLETAPYSIKAPSPGI